MSGMAALFLATLTQATSAQPVPAPVAPPAIRTAPKPRAYSNAEKALGVEIAEMLNSREDTARSLDKAFGPELTKTLSTQPQYAMLEKQYPGITPAIGAALGAELKAAAVAEVPQLWDRLGGIYAETFDLAELQKLLAFYRSAAGKNLVHGVYQNLDTGAMVKRGVDDPEHKATSADIDAATRPAAVRAAHQLNSADQQQLLLFAMSPIGVKLLGVNTRLRTAAVEWTGQFQSKYSEQLEATVIKTGSDYIARAKQSDGSAKHP